MKSFISSIQAAPSYYSTTKATLPTAEERHAAEFDAFRTDAGLTVLIAFGEFVASLAMRVADIVSMSSQSEHRARNGILRDYTTERDVMAAVSTIRINIRKYDTFIGTFMKQLSRVSTLFTTIHADAGNDFMNRIDEADSEFAADYKAIRQQIIVLFRPFKCQDPQMLYPLLYAIYMACRYDVMLNYVASFVPDIKRGGQLDGLHELNVHKPLIKLAHRLNFVDRDGHPMHFIFNAAERTEYARQSAKRSFQIRHRDNPPVVVDAHLIFSFDDIIRCAWRLETHMMELKTIDRLILASEGHDPEYRHDFSMKRLQSCCETFEQTMLNQAIHTHKWGDLPRRMRDYIDSVARRRSIDPRRRPRPVVGFRLKTRVDSKGNPVIDPRTNRPDYYPELIGIWNSSYEAQCEWGTPWQDIQRSIRHKAMNDGSNNIWVTLDTYLTMLYHSMLKVRPDTAAEFLHLVPEIHP